MSETNAVWTGVQDSRRDDLDAEALAAVFGLRKSGWQNWNEPCPLCGGNDRSYASERNGRTLLSCRRCMTKDAPDWGARYGQVMQLARDRLGGRSAPLNTCPAPRRSTPAPSSTLALQF